MQERNNEKVIEVLSRGQQQIRQLLAELNEAQAPWNVIERIANVGQGLDHCFYNLAEESGHRLANGSLIENGSMLAYHRPIRLGDEVGKKIEVLRRSLDEGIERVLQSSIDEAEKATPLNEASNSPQ